MAIAEKTSQREPDIYEDALHERGTDTTRIQALSDAVFAVAITLLVIDIKVPDIGKTLDINHALLAALASRFPDILSYIISFLVIGMYWRAHHRIFQYIERYDTTLLRLNIFLLLLIAFLPFPTSMIGSYESSIVSVVFYAICMALTGLAMFAIWWYASRGHHLVRQDLSDTLIQFLDIRFLITPIIFFLSIGLAFTNAFSPTLPGPRLTEYSWVLIALALAAHIIWYRRKAETKKSDHSSPHLSV